MLHNRGDNLNLLEANHLSYLSQRADLLSTADIPLYLKGPWHKLSTESSTSYYSLSETEMIFFFPLKVFHFYEAMSVTITQQSKYVFRGWYLLTVLPNTHMLFPNTNHLNSFWPINLTVILLNQSNVSWGPVIQPKRHLLKCWMRCIVCVWEALFWIVWLSLDISEAEYSLNYALVSQGKCWCG